MHETKKSGYDWCLEANIRVLDLNKWESDEMSGEKSYFEEKISAKEFYLRLENCEVKANSQPRKTDMYLEYRMYGMVPYNLSPIQQGIQFGHGVVEYSEMVRNTSEESTYRKWVVYDKTFIILNGGTTNTNLNKLGTLNQHYNTLYSNGITLERFYEPDLGDQLTAIVFLVDERVFNKVVHPDFIEEKLPWGKKKPSEKEVNEMDAKNAKNYERWVEKIGGANNAWLREFLKPFRLA